MLPDVGEPGSMVSNIQDLTELRESIKQCAEYTEKQLKNIDTKNGLFATLSLIISIIALFGFGSVLGYLKIIGLYWIPISFLLWFLWIIYGLIRGKKSFINLNQKNASEREKFASEWIYKIVYPAIIGIFILYLITLFFILAINFNFIESQKEITSRIPIIACVIFLLSPFVIKINQKYQEKIPKKESPWLLLMATIIALGLTIVIPFLAFIETIELVFIYSSLLEIFFIFVLVLIIQVFFILLFYCSISTLIAELELKNTITSFSRINDQISNFLLNPKEIQEDSIIQLKRQFQLTKKYDVCVVVLFFFKTYVIIPNQIFFQKC